jgi:hypothetical protein
MTAIKPIGNDAPAAPSSRSRLWLWFLAGFLLVVIGMSFLSMDFYDGRAVHRTRLWHYYLLEIERSWNSTGNLGPTSGSSGATATIVLQHVLFSVLGGAIMLTVGWFVRKQARKS